MEDEYLNLLRHFHAEGVEYVVVGGYAVVAHGFPRTTGDLDLLVNLTPPKRGAGAETLRLHAG